MVDIYKEMQELICLLMKTYNIDKFVVSDELKKLEPFNFEIIAHKNYENNTTTYHILEKKVKV